MSDEATSFATELRHSECAGSHGYNVLKEEWTKYHLQFCYVKHVFIVHSKIRMATCSVANESVAMYGCLGSVMLCRHDKTRCKKVSHEPFKKIQKQKDVCVCLFVLRAIPGDCKIVVHVFTNL